MSRNNRNILLGGVITFVFWVLMLWVIVHQSSRGETSILTNPENVLVVLIISAFLVLIFAIPLSIKMYSERRENGRSTQLEEQAKARGWGYQSDENGVNRFSGTTSSVPWQIEVATHQAGNSFEGYTLWRTDAVRLSGEIVLLVSKAGKAGRFFTSFSRHPENTQLLDTAVNELFVSYQVTSVMLIEDPEDDKEYEGVQRAFHNIRSAQAGSAPLRERYFVLAHNEATARRFLDEDAERMLMELGPDQESNGWKPKVMAVVYWNKGIQFIVEGRVDEFEKLEQLVQLGVALASGQ